jgi:hypothetical protein
MYDVYLKGKVDLLVLPSGLPLPPDLRGIWRRKKRAVRSVSDKIRDDIQLRGYHHRKLTDRGATLPVHPPALQQIVNRRWHCCPPANAWERK